MPISRNRDVRRFLVEHCTVQCRATGAMPTDDEPRFPVLNLGIGGIQFLTQIAPNVNQPVQLSIHAPDHDEPIETAGLIKWVEGIPGERILRVGVVFDALPPETQAAIGRLEGAHRSRPDELLDACVSGLKLPPALSAKVRRLMEMAVAAHEHDPALADATHLVPPDPEPDQTDADAPHRPGADEVDRILSQALSKQTAHEQAEPTPTPALKPTTTPLDDSGYLALHARLLDPAAPLPAEIDRNVFRYLQIFLPAEADFVAYHLADDTMLGPQPPPFPPGTIVIFAQDQPPESGDCALVETSQGLVFRQVFIEDERVRLRPLNPKYPDIELAKDQVASISRLVGRYETF